MTICKSIEDYDKLDASDREIARKEMLLDPEPSRMEMLINQRLDAAFEEILSWAETFPRQSE